jgi:hypothetical protein
LDLDPVLRRKIKLGPKIMTTLSVSTGEKIPI